MYGIRIARLLHYLLKMWDLLPNYKLVFWLLLWRKQNCLPIVKNVKFKGILLTLLIIDQVYILHLLASFYFENTLVIYFLYVILPNYNFLNSVFFLLNCMATALGFHAYLYTRNVYVSEVFMLTRKSIRC